MRRIDAADRDQSKRMAQSTTKTTESTSQEVAQLQREVRDLAQRKRAVILVHNYQPPAIQEIADHLGDSLGLCRQAQETDARILLFCGVVFMAETAAILNRVLIPDPTARCPMAAQLPASLVRQARRQHPGLPVILYVNTLAEAKAEADITCTSANLCQVLRRLDAPQVLFGPDANMAHYASNHCSRKVIPIPPDGGCPVHRAITVEHTTSLLEKHPQARLLAHPECNPPVQAQAHHIGSTEQMLSHAKSSPATTFIIATEVDMVTRLRRELPHKTFIPANPNAICQAMKLHTLQKIKAALLQERHQVTVHPQIARRARRAIYQMLQS